MLTDADLPDLSADKTLWHTLHGVYLRGSKKPVEIEVRWFWAKEHAAARANVAFLKLDQQKRDLVEVELIAKHLVLNWRNVPGVAGGEEPYDADGLRKLLLHIHASAPDIWLPLRATVIDAEKFGRPVLVDAEALGEG